MKPARISSGHCSSIRTTAMPWRCKRSSPWCRTTKTKRSRWPGRRSGRLPILPQRRLPCPMPSRPGLTWKARAPVWKKRCNWIRKMRWRGHAWPSSSRHSANSRKLSKRRRRRLPWSPISARTQTVLGFAYLTQVKTTTGEGGLCKSHRAGSGRSPPAAGSGTGQDPGGQSGRGQPGHRDCRQPGPQQLPDSQLSGQSLL